MMIAERVLAPNVRPHWRGAVDVRNVNSCSLPRPVKAGGWAIHLQVFIEKKRENKKCGKKPRDKAGRHIKDRPRRGRTGPSKHDCQGNQPIASARRQKHPRSKFSPPHHAKRQKRHLQYCRAEQRPLVRFGELDAHAHKCVTWPNVKALYPPCPGERGSPGYTGHGRAWRIQCC